jgi:hypothetical protein
MDNWKIVINKYRNKKKNINIYDDINKDIYNNNNKTENIINNMSYMDNTITHNNLIKKLLCDNILKTNKCKYGTLCNYAHNYEEQNIDIVKKKAYDIIINKEQIDCRIDKELYNVFVLFTNNCELCELLKCPGGYNCKNGVMSKKYKICEKDLLYGNCCNTQCKMVHLTNQGLIPMHFKILYDTNHDAKKHKQSNIYIPNKIILNDLFFVNKKD